jgi:NADP-dependent 3-hydroxy acid dehydrogenase YdfG
MNSTNRLEGAVALVTGASSGIGAATARALASEGAAVALIARRRERLDDLAREIAHRGGRALAIDADITHRPRAEEAVERVVAELGRLDILVNNAGVMLLGPAAEAPIEEWERMVKINVEGLLFCTHAAIPHLLDAAATSPRTASDIINISSVAGRVARSGSGVYNLTKFGVTAFSESLRQEFAKRHLRVASVEPGAVETELFGHVREGVRSTVEQRFAGVTRLEADDIAEAILYIVTRPWRMAVNEMLIRPTEQEG